MENLQINTIENFLSDKECDDIIKKYKRELILSVAGVASGDPKNRKSSIGWIDDLGEINERLKCVLKKSFNLNGMEVTGLGSFQFTEYKIGEFYAWHTDRDNEKFRERFASAVIQLNENYEGGLLEIKDQKGKLIPLEYKIGNLYIFDSGLRHRVTPVETGTRYSLVNWVSLIKTDPTKQNIL